MALDPKIASLKAAGTYRFEFDKSQVVSIPANQTRLVVGFSKRGPFNTPVFIPDTAFFKQVYGDIDRNLERKDSFFHRSCLSALERGPILALNLLTLTADDKVNAIRFGTAATPNAQANAGADFALQSMYNRDKFWFPSTSDFLTNVGADQTKLTPTGISDLLDVTNLGQTPISVIAKKSAATNVLQYQVTVEEWYGAANVPGYLNKDSLISDFFVDIFVIGGNFGGDFSSTTPYSRFASDPTFQQYFDPTRGLKRRVLPSDSTDTYLAQFFNETEVQLQATYTACLLPDFVDLLGNNLFVEKLVNADTASTGLFVTVNENLFSGDFLIDGVPGGIDLVGHNIEHVQENGSQTDVNFLSYSGPIVSDLDYAAAGTPGTTVTNGGTNTVTIATASSGDFTLQVAGPAGAKDTYWTAFSTMTANSATVVGSYILTNAGLSPAQYVPVTSVQVSGNNIVVTLSSTGDPVVGNFDTAAPFNYIDETDFGFVADEIPYTIGGVAGVIGSYGSSLYTAFQDGTLTDGDEVLYGQTSASGVTSWLVFNAVESDYGFVHTATPTLAGNKIAISDSAYFLPSVRVLAYQDAQFATLATATNFSIDGDATKFFWSSKTPSVSAGAGVLGIQTLKGSLNTTFDIIAGSAKEPLLKPNQILINTADLQIAKVIVGNYLLNSEGVAAGGYSRLTRINSVVGGITPAQYPAADIPAAGTAVLVTCQSEILINTVAASPSDILKVELYYPIDSWIDNLNIFQLPGYALPLSKQPDGTNARQNTILSPILGGTNLYKALTDRETINFRYVVDTFGNGIEANCKSIYTKLCEGRKNAFAIINAPSAKDFKASTDPSFTDLTGGLSSRMISDGGDLSKNPTVRYSLPSATAGGSWGGYYYPFITVRDLGKNINVPPAANVSNNFILKYENALPWSIVAGVRRGVLGGNGVVGLEINLDKDDRYYLEPFGINPIIFQSGTGPTIFANKTGQQVPKSALSSINVREVVIYIQDGIDAILKNYLFEFNTAQTRLEIKTLADNFLSTVQNDDGVYDYRNIMDETNNTPEVIDQNVGILDTYIEPVRGMEILVQRTTILRTGAISTGNFQ